MRNFLITLCNIKVSKNKRLTFLLISGFYPDMVK